jgi:hypothetical protein
MPEPINDDPMIALRACGERCHCRLSDRNPYLGHSGLRHAEAGLDEVQVGMLFSIYALMTLLMRPIVGPAMDRFGRRRFSSQD